MKPIGQPILSDNAKAVASKHQGLCFYGIVDTYTDANNCAVSGLAGRGDGLFEGYYLWAVRDSSGAGAAPQGERVRITSYASATGALVHEAFTTPLAADDEVLLLHPILVEAISGGGSGDIEIFDSFEYPTAAALRAAWIEGGGAGDPTRSATAYEGQYSMQTVVAGSAGQIHRLFATRNMKTLANIGIASQSSAGGDTFRFTLYDSSGNHSYWTQTCNAAPDTWTYHNINPHSAPDGSSATPADLSDIVEIRMANLTAGETYKFDFIKFSSLVSSIIGAGYDGLSDSADETSSVRGHLLFTNDNIEVPAKDAIADALMRDVTGKKEDDAQTTVGTTRSIIAYVKGLLNQVATIIAKTNLLNSASGTSTLNDANVSDTIVPSSLPTNVHVILDISTIIVAADDFTLEVKVGASGSERVVAYYRITSDGTDTTIDTGSGTGAVVKQRRIDISDVLVYTGEQVLLNYTKNGATSRDVLYKYVCGV